MRSKIFIALFALMTMAGCKKDYLERYPQDELTDDTFWTSENNVRTFAWGFYTNYFDGYGSGFTFGRYFSGQSLNDDFAPSVPSPFLTVAPTSGGGWSFTWVRKANIFIDRIKGVPMADEAKNHWTGVGRFFRALEYADLVKTFGDVPYYNKPLLETDPDLYKPRDSRTLVMDSVLADLKYAADNVRVSDGTAGVTVNKYVVLAFMSRIMLFEGTFQKYHNLDAAKSREYLEAAKWAAEQVIGSGKYSVATSYRGVFNSLDLANNKEVILYRRYEPGMITHSLNSYVNKEPQTGASRDVINTYLSSDGLPIGVSPLYKGENTVTDVMTNRDPRMKETFVSQLRLNGEVANYSTTGYATHKFLNEAIKDLPEGSSSLNPTDAPVIRFGEVLLNYAEAAAELGNMTQADIDKSINTLRARPGINMPRLLVQGESPAVEVSGTITTYDDPERDPSVSPLIWEIRRERRVELVFEGFRLDDLKRWKKLEYTDTRANPDINRGAWVVKAEHPNMRDVKIENDAPAGYIIPAWKPETQRIFNNPRVYLNPLPLDQIKLYKDQGKELTQNPGW